MNDIMYKIDISDTIFNGSIVFSFEIINVSTERLKWCPIPDKNTGIYVTP